MKRLLISIAIMLLFVAGIANAKCPSAELLSPCVCSADNIVCAGTTNYDLRHIFASISNQTILDSEKHFKQFYLNNTAIPELVADVFADITFEDIDIERARNLSRISSQAFTRTNNFTRRFQLRQTPVHNNDSNYNIFQALSGLTAVELIDVFNTEITSIPENAFHSVNNVTQEALHSLSISGNNRVTTVGDKAFYELPGLRVLDLYHNRIDYLPAQAFDFRKRNSANLVIALNNNRLNESSFASGIFSGSGHIFDLDLSNNEDLDTLEQSIFEPLLKNGTRIDLGGDYLSCDCDLYWVIQNKEKYMQQLVGAKCDELDLFANTTLNAFRNCTFY